jgi:hypothetical protein
MKKEINLSMEFQKNTMREMQGKRVKLCLFNNPGQKTKKRIEMNSYDLHCDRQNQRHIKIVKIQ